jgi:hypothetical protein
MPDLKFFYIVELNLLHPAVSKIPLAQEFEGQSFLTLTSESFVDDEKCIKKLKKFMKAKAKMFSEDQRIKLNFAENPLLNCAESQLDKIDIGDFDEHALVSMDIKDLKDKWLMRASVMVFEVHLTNSRTLH